MSTLKLLSKHTHFDTNVLKKCFFLNEEQQQNFRDQQKQKLIISIALLFKK